MSQDLSPPLRRWRKEAGPGEHRALLVGPAVVSPVQLLCVHGIGTVIDSNLTWAIRDPMLLSVKDSDSSSRVLVVSCGVEQTLRSQHSQCWSIWQARGSGE